MSGLPRTSLREEPRRSNKRGGGGAGPALAFGEAAKQHSASSSSSFLSPAASFEARPPQSAASVAMVLPELFGGQRASKRGTSWLGTPPHGAGGGGAGPLADLDGGGFFAKKSRFIPEEEVENMKRHANCLTSSSTVEGASPFCGAADKRARPQSDHRMRVDPFVQAYLEDFKMAAGGKIRAVQAELARETARNQELEAANQTLKHAVPALNRRFQEASGKVTQLEQVVGTYGREVHRLRQLLQEKESECQLLRLHLQRGTCTTAHNASMFDPFGRR